MIGSRDLESMSTEEVLETLYASVNERTAEAGPVVGRKAMAIAGALFSILPVWGKARTSYCTQVAIDLALEIEAVIPGPCGPSPLIAGFDLEAPDSERLFLTLSVIYCGESPQRIRATTEAQAAYLAEIAVATILRARRELPPADGVACN